jgi:hypothetical protein
MESVPNQVNEQFKSSSKGSLLVYQEAHLKECVRSLFPNISKIALFPTSRDISDAFQFLSIRISEMTTEEGHVLMLKEILEHFLEFQQHAKSRFNGFQQETYLEYGNTGQDVQDLLEMRETRNGFISKQ